MQIQSATVCFFFCCETQSYHIACSGQYGYNVMKLYCTLPIGSSIKASLDETIFLWQSSQVSNSVYSFCSVESAVVLSPSTSSLWEPFSRPGDETARGARAARVALNTPSTEHYDSNSVNILHCICCIGKMTPRHTSVYSTHFQSPWVRWVLHMCPWEKTISTVGTSILQVVCPSRRPTNSVKLLKMNVKQ